MEVLLDESHDGWSSCAVSQADEPDRLAAPRGAKPLGLMELEDGGGDVQGKDDLLFRDKSCPSAGRVFGEKCLERDRRRELVGEGNFGGGRVGWYD